MIDGYVLYILPEKTVAVEDMKVNDGKWHYFETRWLKQQLVVTLDYGEITVSSYKTCTAFP